MAAVGRPAGDPRQRRRPRARASCSARRSDAGRVPHATWGRFPTCEAWDLQRSLAAAVSQGAIPDTVLLLEHPPVITLGRRTDEGELHVPDGAEVEIVETDRGGKSTYHGPGPARLLPDPRPDPPRPGREALLPRPRGGADPHARSGRRRGDADRGPDRNLGRGPARGRSRRSACTSRSG